jgi:uncharacterized integral membrane protein
VWGKSGLDVLFLILVAINVIMNLLFMLYVLFFSRKDFPVAIGLLLAAFGMSMFIFYIGSMLTLSNF